MALSPGHRLGPTRSSRRFAAKIPPAHLSENAEVRERFEREARAISSLNHPHICTLYDVGREGDADYFVIELLDGESLATHLTRGPLKLDEALRVAAQIADALAAAHKRGIVRPSRLEGRPRKRPCSALFKLRADLVVSTSLPTASASWPRHPWVR